MKRLALIITGDRNATNDRETEMRWFAVINRHMLLLVERYSFIYVIHGACGQDQQPNGTVSGDLKGIDKLADELRKNYRNVAPVPFPAKWTELGAKAGPMRNTAMLDIQQMLVNCGCKRLTLAYHDGDITKRGSGTGDCVNQSRARGVKTRHFRSDGTEVTWDERRSQIKAQAEANERLGRMDDKPYEK